MIGYIVSIIAAFLTVLCMSLLAALVQMVPLALITGEHKGGYLRYRTLVNLVTDISSILLPLIIGAAFMNTITIYLMGPSFSLGVGEMAFLSMGLTSVMIPFVLLTVRALRQLRNDTMSSESQDMEFIRE